MPAALCGDRHQAISLPDGRLLIQFRDLTPSKKPSSINSPTEGDWVGWVGRWEDLEKGSEGEYRLRLKDNRNGWDTAYPAAELLPDGTLVCTSYGHFDRKEASYIRSVRFKMEETDADARKQMQGKRPIITNDMGSRELIFDPNKPDEINKRINTPAS